MKENVSTDEGNPFEGYENYIEELSRLTREPVETDGRPARVHAALNGESSYKLRHFVSLPVRRKFGTFFTGTDLATKLLDKVDNINSLSLIYDPTCGMGDLLLAAARRLPICRNIKSTIKQWGKQLAGTDLHPEFVRGAKLRLLLLAQALHGSNVDIEDLGKDAFPLICVKDAKVETTLFHRATHLLLNPPFGKVQVPPDCEWASGKFTEAADFLMRALVQASLRAKIFAIMPEVLRSGAFSKSWRAHVEQNGKVEFIETSGVFDQSADIDVFIIGLSRRKEKESNPPSAVWIEIQQEQVLKDCFEVHVGRVVPHRDKHTGPLHPYIHAKCLPTWAIVSEFSEFRRHAGQMFNPPFVVIRRTSRPGHVHRAAATVISGKIGVAVENHLIVCQPRDKKLASCKKLMAWLKTGAVNDFLNQRIRCRHLTVGSVKSIPYSDK